VIPLRIARKARRQSGDIPQHWPTPPFCSSPTRVVEAGPADRKHAWPVTTWNRRQVKIRDSSADAWRVRAACPSADRRQLRHESLRQRSRLNTICVDTRREVDQQDVNSTTLGYGVVPAVLAELNSSSTPPRTAAHGAHVVNLFSRA